MKEDLKVKVEIKAEEKVKVEIKEEMTFKQIVPTRKEEKKEKTMKEAVD